MSHVLPTSSKLIHFTLERPMEFQQVNLQILSLRSKATNLWWHCTTPTQQADKFSTKIHDLLTESGKLMELMKKAITFCCQIQLPLRIQKNMLEETK
jgi:hypothetical protein